MSETMCPVCGEGRLKTTLEVRRYGRNINVTLVDVPVRRCPHCGEELLAIPAIEELHRLIAHGLARSTARLRPGEVRFLRTYLGYSSKDFAAVMGVAAETVSRWENERAPQRMATAAERLLRLMALQDKPIESYGLEAAGTEESRTPAMLRLTSTGQGWAAA